MDVAEEINPLWLRTWHGLQALMFLGLVVSGLNLHYLDAPWVFLSFPTAVKTHNVCGVGSALLWSFFLVVNKISGNQRHYVPRKMRIRQAFSAQLRYYTYDMFRSVPPPAPEAEGSKFNPVQLLTYVAIMYVVLPLSILSGIVLLYPVLAPATALAWGGLWPTALVHLAAGYVLTLFLIFHVYLATTGETVGTLYREMLTGVRHSNAPPPPPPA